MTKMVFVLNVDGYSPEITELTYPLVEKYTSKIGASFRMITNRAFPEWPVTYEKLQIYELGKGSDWNIYFDSDVLIHPDMVDITEFVGKDTIVEYGNDLAANHWVYDDYFRRDGRHISTCTWMAFTSDWCLDFWKPIEGMEPEQAIANCHVMQSEKKAGIDASHLVDDYAISKNVARYGLKVKSFKDLAKEFGHGNWEYLYHQYTIPKEEKIRQMKETLTRWGL